MSHILVFDKEKGKVTKKYNVWCPKSQRLALQIEISKISSIDLKMRCIDSKRWNDMMYMEPNETLQSYDYQVFVGGHIYIFL